MVKPDDGRQYTHVLRVSDGRYVGSLRPAPRWAAPPAGRTCPTRSRPCAGKDGEYLVLVEEDWRGKNLLYRWRPEGPPAALRKRESVTVSELLVR